MNPLRAILAAVCALTAVLAVAGAAGAQTETFQVTNLNDSGAGSLRDAINQANASTATTRRITFDVAGDGTIDLATPLPNITKGVTIDGSTADNLTISGDSAGLIFRVDAQTTSIVALQLEEAPIEIGDGASLEFNGSADQQFDDVLTDLGRLVKDGSATLTLRGANDYSGGTLIRNGTLRGDTTSLQGDIANNAILEFNQDSSGEYAGTISGTGAVRKTGTGEVFFSGGNTYSGGTTVSAGSLRGDVDNLQGNIDVKSAARVVIEQATDDTFTGNLTGAGGFTKTGAGVLTLTGSNTISGQTNLDAGGLRGGPANLPSKIATAAGTAIVFDHNNNSTYAGAISGMGTVTKNGTGRLTLSGKHTYTGTTTINAGTLSANPLNLPNTATSNIVNDSNLIFNATATGSYLGVISGTGNLTKQGGGTLSLTRNHTFTGLTSITAGRLDVDGSLVGNVDVGSVGILGGIGSVGGSVTAGGTVAPGKSIGTLSVDQIAFASGSVFEVEVNDLGMGAGIADLLDVAGSADLAGASLQVDPGAGNYLDPVNVTILTTGVDLATTFASFGPQFAFLDIALNTFARSVELTLSRNAMGLGEYAQTPNQTTIAAALEAALGAGIDPDIDTVFDSLNVLTVAQVPGALESMTGESLSQFATTRLATAERFGQSLDARIRDHQSAESRALIAVPSTPREEGANSADASREPGSPLLAVAMLGAGPLAATAIDPESANDSWIRTWIDGSGIYGDVDGSSNESGFDYDIWGGSLGTDVILADHWVLGVAGGYARANLDFSSQPGSGEIDTYQGAVYAAYVDPRFHVGVSGRYAYNGMDGERPIAVIAPARTARSDLDGHDYGARFEGALNLLEVAGIKLQPLASVNYTRLTQDDVTESGAGALNLAIEDHDLDSLVMGIGARIHARWQISPVLWLVPELRGRWLHEFLDTDRFIEARLVSAPSTASAFRIQGFELPRDSGSVGLSWSVVTDTNWSVVASYDAILNTDLVQHVGSLTLNFEW